MKVAVIGSRGMTVTDLGDYLPPDTTEIVSGGAKGVDACAAAKVCGNHRQRTNCPSPLITIVPT